MAEKIISTEFIWSTSLGEEHMRDVDLFKCSEPKVEQFLKKEAIRLEKHHTCKTHLYYYKDNLLGYYTLFTDYVNLTRSKRNSEGWGDVSTLLGNQHFPAIRLHYIGIDDKYRNKGLIELLLLFALDDCIYISNYVGFNFVVLEALKRSVGFFEKQNFSKVKKNNDLQIMAIKVEDIVFQLGS